jgi:iron complex outermembrane receptor protein
MPDLWDMDWLLSGHMTRRNQLAPLGQSMGTFGTQRFPDGTTIRGRLGGSSPNASGYVEPDIVEMRDTRRDELREEGLTFSDALNQANLEVADELAANLDIRPREGDYNRVGKLRNGTGGVFLRGDMSFGRSIDFTTITAFDRYDRHNEQDVDNTPMQLFELHQDDVGWQFTEDLRLNGELTDSIRWESGGYFLMEQIDAEIENFFLTNQGISDRLYEQSLYSWAIYGGFDVDFWDDLNFYAGLRYNWEQKSMRYSLVFNTQPRVAEDSQVRSAPTWTFRLKYALGDATEVYAKYSRGWKGGHFNAVGSLGDSDLDFAEPETVDSWEAGFRGFWLERRVGMEASFFYYRYADYQVFTFNQAFKSAPELIVINANDAENFGAEVDLTLNPIDPFMLLFRMGWLESQFLDFTQENVATTFKDFEVVSFPVIVNNSGNRLINSPQIQFTIMAEYELDLGWFGSITPRYDTSWKSDTYFDATEGRGPPNVAQGVPVLPENTIGQEAFWLHNFRLTYKLGSSDFQIAGWVRNFTDETYKAGGFNATGFNNFVVLFLGEPRTWGIDLSYQF